MEGHEVHVCPRCDLRFTSVVELRDHLDRDHAVVPAVPAQPVLHGTILVPVDPARPPTLAPAVAATLARGASLAVELVAVALDGMPPAATDAYLAARLREAFAAGAPSVTARNLGPGPVAEKLAAHAGEVRPLVLCMATRSRSAVGQFVLGSVADDLLRRSEVPVVLVGPEAQAVDRYTTVLVALDGSEHAEAVIEPARTLAVALGARLRLVEVVDPDVRIGGDVVDSGYLHHLAASLPTPAEYDTPHGHHPAPAILDEAGGAATIVAMGTHGRSALLRAALGSVAFDVVRAAPGPVLVFPPAACDAMRRRRHDDHERASGPDQPVAAT